MNIIQQEFFYKLLFRAVTDPRSSERVALKKMPQVFLNLITAKRVFRELRMLCSFRHENVLQARDVLLPCSLETFEELYVLTPLMQSDLHKIIVSNQTLTIEHVKIFTYQILRGKSNKIILTLFENLIKRSPRSDSICTLRKILFLLSNTKTHRLSLICPIMETFL
jgi:hypothetical protein